LRDVAASGSTEFDAGRRFADDFCSRMRLVGHDVVYERLARLARVLHTKMFGPQAHLSTALAEHLPGFDIDECAVSELVHDPTKKIPLGTLSSRSASTRPRCNRKWRRTTDTSSCRRASRVSGAVRCS